MRIEKSYPLDEYAWKSQEIVCEFLMDALKQMGATLAAHTDVVSREIRLVVDTGKGGKGWEPAAVVWRERPRV